MRLRDILCEAYLLQVVSVRLKVSNPKAAGEIDGLSDGFGAETPASYHLEKRSSVSVRSPGVRIGLRLCKPQASLS